METIAETQEPKIQRTPVKALTEPKSTPVILVCIYNKSGAIITHDLLYSIFAPYGKVLRILIFEKLKVWKAFVEYASIDSALEARKNLNDVMLFNDGTKLTIHSSNLETVKFQNNNTGGIDYTQVDPNTQGEQNRMLQGGIGSNSNIGQPQGPRYSHDGSDGNPGFPNTRQFEYQQGHNLHVSNEKDDDLLRLAGKQVSRVHDQHPEREESRTMEEIDKDDFNSMVSDAFKSKPNAQVGHMHQVHSQLYRDNQSPPHHQHNDPHSDSAFPPGLMISLNNSYGNQPQPQPLQPGPGRLVRNAMSMNYIPMSNSSGLSSGLSGNPLQGGLNKPSQMPNPLGSMPQFGSLNSLPQTSQNSGYGQQPMLQEPVNQSGYHTQFGQQQRPQINRFFSQGEIPLMGPGKLSGPGPVGLLGRGLNPGSSDNLAFLPSVGSFDSLPSTSGGVLDYGSLSNMNKSTLHQLHDNLSMLLGKGEENKKSKVLYVKGLEHKDIKVNMLYNIFSNFGNIMKIIFISSKSSALVEFETVEYATVCMDYLNNIVFMGKPLRVYYSKYSLINLRNKKGEEPGEEVFIGSAKTFRFKQNKTLSINPPSATLHISNLIKEICTEEALGNYFAVYGRIEAIKFIFGENNKNMCLLRMGSIEESLNAIAYLHDTDLGGRKIQISFTRSKI